MLGEDKLARMGIFDRWSGANEIKRVRFDIAKKIELLAHACRWCVAGALANLDPAVHVVGEIQSQSCEDTSKSLID